MPGSTVPAVGVSAVTGQAEATVAKRAATVAARRRRTGFRTDQRVRVNAPRSPRWHGRVGKVEAVWQGELFVLGAWFAPAELVDMEGR